MPKYLVELTDGRKFEVEADSQPSEADILAELGGSPAPRPTMQQAEAPPQPEGSALGRFASNLGSQLNPLTMVQGLVHAVANPIDTGKAIFESQMQQFDKAGEAAAQGRVSEMLGHGLAGLIPVVGPAAAAAGEQIGTGDVAGGLGTGAGLLAGTVGAGPVARAAGKAAQPLAQRAGEALYQSALKPTKAILKDVRVPKGAGPDAARQTLVQTGLREGIPVSQRGAEKAAGLIDNLNAEVDARLAAAEQAGKTVDPAFVEAQIREVAQDFTHQVNAQPDLAAIATVRENFLTNPNVAQPVFPVQSEAAALQGHLQAGRSPASFVAPSPELAPGPIPIRTAQQMKSNTYRGLRGKYGTERTATIEAEKAGARGLKEQIETQAGDDIAALNAREGQLIPLEQAVADAMRRRGNYGVFGLTPIVASIPAVTHLNPWPLLAALVDRMPGVVSRTGIALSRAGQRSGRTTQNVARAGLVGQEITERALVPVMAGEDPADPQRARARR